LIFLAFRVLSLSGISRARTYDLHDVNEEGNRGRMAGRVENTWVVAFLEFHVFEFKGKFGPDFERHGPIIGPR
jgi:hypothetical protein